MDLPAALDFIRPRKLGVLVTKRRNGNPQLSNIWYHLGDNGVIRVSITAGRAKYHNIDRQGWAALHVTTPEFGSYAVVEGPAEVTPPSTELDDTTVEELVALYRAMAGEHPDWDDYRRAMVADGRAVVRLTPDHGYGIHSV